MKSIFELVLIPFVVGVATEVVADWLIQHIQNKRDKHYPEFSLKTKKKTVAGTTVFFALCQKYLRTLALSLL